MTPFQFDRQQLRLILRSVSQKEPGRWSKLEDLVKTLAIVGAASWTLYLYFSEQRQMSELGLAHAKLDNSRIELESLVAREKRKIEAEGEFSIEFKIQTDPSQETSFRDVWLTYSPLNNGQVPVTIDRVVVQWFTGELTPAGREKTLVNVNLPPLPNPYSSGSQTIGPQPILWATVSMHGCSADLNVMAQLSGKGVSMESHGCGLGQYEPGTGGVWMDDAIVTDPHVQLVGASVVILYTVSGVQKSRRERLFKLMHLDAEKSEAGSRVDTHKPSKAILKKPLLAPPEEGRRVSDGLG